MVLTILAAMLAPKMQFSDDAYIAEAVRRGIVADKASALLFRCGHFMGVEAVKHLLLIRDGQVSLVPPRMNKIVFSSTIEKLGNGYYNGRSLDSIICESTSLLGERQALYQVIVSANTQSSRILSKDGLYALPFFMMRDVDSCDPRFEFYRDVFMEFFDGVSRDRMVPRSREDVVSFLESLSSSKQVVDRYYRYDLDMVISYLVRRNLL